nr:PREDICTED: spidroin-2-like [Equus przewalskii]
MAALEPGRAERAARSRRGPLRPHIPEPRGSPAAALGAGAHSDPRRDPRSACPRRRGPGSLGPGVQASRGPAAAPAPCNAAPKLDAGARGARGREQTMRQATIGGRSPGGGGGDGSKRRLQTRGAGTAVSAEPRSFPAAAPAPRWPCTQPQPASACATSGSGMGGAPGRAVTPTSPPMSKRGAKGCGQGLHSRAAHQAR